MKTQQQLKEYVSAHPGLTVRDIVRNLHRQNVRPENVRAAMAGGAVVAKAGNVKTLADFRKEHDCPQKLREAIKRLGKGYVSESEMRTMAQIPNQRWRGTADSPEFDDNRIKANGSVLWASKQTIAEMKTIMGL